MEEDQYKSVLIVNDTNDDQITLYIYPWWDVICWVSSMSKIIMPNKKYLHRCKKDFQFKLVAINIDTIGKRRKRTLRETAEWQRDVLFKITNSTADSSSPYNVDEGDLANYPQEKRICLRMLQRDKEMKSTAGGRNYYEVLGLDMDNVRKMPKDEQDEILRKAWKRGCLRWHPDKNGGYDEVYLEIDAAYTLLKDHADRAHYNNMVDYDSGWFSRKRYRALFIPTCVTDEQRKARNKRWFAMGLSVVLLLGGIALTAGTAGLALPAAVACGAVFGGGLTGAGLQSLQHTVKRSTVDKGVSEKDWLLKASIGFLGGAVTGGTAVGMTAAVTGIGAAALESAAVTAGQYIGIGAGTGAVGGVVSSLASDAGRKFVDGADVSWKQVLGHALTSGAIGAVVGVAGGAVTHGVVGAQTRSAAAANLEGEIAEQLVTLAGGRRLGNVLSRNLSRMVTEAGLEATLGTPMQLVEERMNDLVENQGFGDHAVKGLKDLGFNLGQGAVLECGGAIADHASNEWKVRSKLKEEPKSKNVTNEKTSEVESTRRGRIRSDLSKKNNEHRVQCQNVKSSAKYTPLENEEPSIPEPSAGTSAVTQEEPDNNEPDNSGRVKYISEGFWSSKMVVSYTLSGNEVTQEVQGSGKAINIPAQATSITVKFQVLRPGWWDISKYDRSQKRWCKPYEPHVFHYAKPPIRTFTIYGNLWWEAVMRVSDEYHEETGEM